MKTKIKIKTNLEIELSVSINKDVRDISMLSLDILKNDLMQRLCDNLKSYPTADTIGKDYPNIKVEQISTGSAKTNIIL